MNARYYDGGRGQFLSQDPVFWSKQNLQNPQSLNSYSYSGNNPIVNKDPDGRKYLDVGGSLTVPVYGVPVGLTGGLDVVSGSNDPYIYFGATVTGRPGPSGSVMYSPDSSPSEGWSGSLSGFFNNGFGGQGVYGKGTNGKFGLSGEVGVGTQGLSGSIVYTIQLSKLLETLGGPLVNLTTPMTIKPAISWNNNTRNTQQNLSGTAIQSRMSAVSTYNASVGASTPQSQLWVMPTGAVVTWSGQVVSGPVKK